MIVNVVFIFLCEDSDLLVAKQDFMRFSKICFSALEKLDIVSWCLYTSLSCALSSAG